MTSKLKSVWALLSFIVAGILTTPLIFGPDGPVGFSASMFATVVRSFRYHAGTTIFWYVPQFLLYWGALFFIGKLFIEAACDE